MLLTIKFQFWYFLQSKTCMFAYSFPVSADGERWLCVHSERLVSFPDFSIFCIVFFFNALPPLCRVDPKLHTGQEFPSIFCRLTLKIQWDSLTPHCNILPLGHQNKNLPRRKTGFFVFVKKLFAEKCSFCILQ